MSLMVNAVGFRDMAGNKLDRGAQYVIVGDDGTEAGPYTLRDVTESGFIVFEEAGAPYVNGKFAHKRLRHGHDKEGERVLAYIVNIGAYYTGAFDKAQVRMDVREVASGDMRVIEIPLGRVGQLVRVLGVDMDEGNYLHCVCVGHELSIEVAADATYLWNLAGTEYLMVGRDTGRGED